MKGVRFVLTASRAEMCDYNYDPFVAFTCTFPVNLTRRILKKFVETKREGPLGRPALYGLRKLEAVLGEHYGWDSVVVCHEDELEKYVGEGTEAVMISTMDPLGKAYVSMTYNSMIKIGGEPFTAVEFKRLLNHPNIKKYKPTVIVGGAGAWQIAKAGLQKKLGIDHIFLGSCEDGFVERLENILTGRRSSRSAPEVGEVVTLSEKVPLSAVKTIRGPSNYGTVEITRGCGRGCHFCSPTMRNRVSFPLDHIMKEVDINVRGGSPMIFTATEDMFLYEAGDNFTPRREKVVKLYKSIAEYPGVKYIALSHASIAPVLWDRKLLEELSPLLLEKTRYTPEYKRSYKKPFVTVEVGIESGSPRIMKKYMRNKARPFSVDNWSELVIEGIGEFNDHDWYPLCTLLTGWPGEDESDTLKTLELVDELHSHNLKLFYTPLLFLPLDRTVLSGEKAVSLSQLTETQWEFFTSCWRYNIDFWAPEKWKIIKPLFTAYHAFFGHWVHGKNLDGPLMRMLYPRLSHFKYELPCDPSLCGGTSSSGEEDVLSLPSVGIESAEEV